MSERIRETINAEFDESRRRNPDGPWAAAYVFAMFRALHECERCSTENNRVFRRPLDKEWNITYCDSCGEYSVDRSQVSQERLDELGLVKVEQ